MPTYVSNLAFVPCQTGNAVNIGIPNAALFPRNYILDLAFIPCQTGIGNSISLPNATNYARHYIPEPFLTAGIQNPTIWGEFDFGPGYVDHPYREQWFIENITQPVVFTLDSGTLPPGLILSTLGNTAAGQIAGTPTTEGLYTFTLLATGPDSSAIKVFHITITRDPAPPDPPAPVTTATGFIYGN